MQGSIDSIIPEGPDFLHNFISLGETYALLNPFNVEIVDSRITKDQNQVFLRHLVENLGVEENFNKLLPTFHHFVASSIEHDLVKQVVTASRTIPSNSSFNILLGTGRCGVKARALADLLVTANVDAGIIVTGQHVLTYIQSGGVMVLDADLYAPGVIPMKDLSFPSLQSYLENDQFLDDYSHNKHFSLERNLAQNEAKSFPLAVYPSSSLNTNTGVIKFYSRTNYVDTLVDQLKVSKNELKLFPYTLYPGS